MPKTAKDLELIAEEFSNKYGETMLLRANIAAINCMLIERGKTEELYNSLSKIIADYKNKVEKNNE